MHATIREHGQTRRHDLIREFKDVVFEDVVFDYNSFVTLLCIVCIVTSISTIS